MSQFWLPLLPFSQQLINYRVASHCAAHPECGAKASGTQCITGSGYEVVWWDRGGRMHTGLLARAIPPAVQAHAPRALGCSRHLLHLPLVRWQGL